LNKDDEVKPMLSSQTSYKEDIKKLRELIEGIRIAHLTTINTDGTLRSRPMATQQMEFDGDLWFFTRRSTHKVDEIEAHPQVCVSYSVPDKDRHVSASGTAAMVDDRAKMEELWNPALKAWFPDGLDDPELTLIKVEVTRAEYWDSPSSKIVELIGFVKALATGKPADDMGENEEIILKN
jgi:general stress protein 26